MNNSNLWLCIGFLGQALFTMRFLVQWIHSERAGQSLIPIAFWYFSILGGCTLLTYALYRRDPVFILGQATGIVIYARNLYFIFRERKQTLPVPNDASPPPCSKARASDPH
jgi:lipid-A-disaccharide synthase-like uncharacterized protein